jgi:hypothetical protein
MIKNDIYINSLYILVSTFIIISATYYYLFTYEDILNIIKEEYILLGFTLVSFLLHFYAYLKLRKFDILPFIPKLGLVPIIQSSIFFAIFEVVDYYSEDGFIGAIKLWYMYWLFGLLSWNLVFLFNYYKNIKFYNLKLL